MPLFKNTYQPAYLPYKCPCCHQPISIGNYEEWVESYEESVTSLGTNHRGRMVMRMGSHKESFHDYVCPRCYKALRRNRFIIPLISFLIFAGFILLIILANGTWKTIGVVGVIASVVLFALDYHFTTEILGICLKPILGPYRIRFMGEDPLMSKALKDEYKTINKTILSLEKYASKEYKISESKAFELFLQKGDIMAKIHADNSLLTLPTIQLFKRLYSEREVFDYLSEARFLDLSGVEIHDNNDDLPF